MVNAWLGDSRQRIRAWTRREEPECLQDLLAQAPPDSGSRQAVQALAVRLAQGLRGQKGLNVRSGLVQGLLQEFSLSSQEGVALMCLAEALLRIPDLPTRDALIRDKIAQADWQSHLGRSDSLFVNAASWGLLLSGRLMLAQGQAGLESALMRAVLQGGEPLIRKGLDLAMRLMGEQFVTGQTIEQALAHARTRERLGFRYSFDMLGEAAMTEADAQRCFNAYRDAIEAIGSAAVGRGVIAGPGISIKLSALHPRYSRQQAARVHAQLYPRLLELARLASAHDIGMNIDAEESERLELSLDLLERLSLEPGLAHWQGLGFVAQAYQKRCLPVVDHLAALARASRRRLMVRLVKGAYWDSEIKRAQTEGHSGFPVYTRKAHTDVSYLACARRLLDQPQEIYPQFATHNAHTVAAVLELAQQRLGPFHDDQYEFQCLHGMGEPLYGQLVDGSAGHRRPCRIYAPVGTYETLLAYLVRRLLENGANTSFVNRAARDDVAVEALVQDPVEEVLQLGHAGGQLGLPHPAITSPQDLHLPARLNSRGLDLNDEEVIAHWIHRRAHGPGLADWPAPQEASQQDVAEAVQRAVAAGQSWSAVSEADRASILERAAEIYERHADQWLHLLVDEAGKTAVNAAAEVREAVDFLRYNAQQLRACARQGPLEALGPVVCISPWNFPLAIFTGQVAAALAAGNPVLAKPAEQTPRIALQAVQALWQAGVGEGALQLLCGPGETVGAQLVANPGVQAVVFTGSTEVASLIQRELSRRLNAQGDPVVLIAETGGQNAMIVDSSALSEQVTADVLTSAFDSAGQRCSALRVLCVQEEAAPALLTMIEGAMDELKVGPAGDLDTDVGPLIDAQAQIAVLGHIERLRALGCRIHQAPMESGLRDSGPYVPPTLIEIESLSQVPQEVFGPVLHVLRYPRPALADALGQIRQTGYGLTMGVHSRIDSTVARALAGSAAGNIYVNRNMVGAVVGVQPFGGQGLSGTGPKAGGPLLLPRLLLRSPPGLARLLVEGSGVAMEPQLLARLGVGAVHDAITGPVWGVAQARQAVHELIGWLQSRGPDGAPTAEVARAHLDQTFTHSWRSLAGPTGEANVYAALPRTAVLCLADDDSALLAQTSAALAIGARVVWTEAHEALHRELPPCVAQAVSVTGDWRGSPVPVQAILVQGDDGEVLRVLGDAAAWPGPIIGVTRTRSPRQPIPLDRLVQERSISVNTAAAGGNASLMTLD